MIMTILNDKETRLNTINELAENENDIMQKAFLEKNLKKRFRLYNNARILRRIKEEIIRWETFTRGY